ncbi:MAG: insulinase family protein [Caldilineaceae bacterium]|nr:insulinase family protein [Caldilineaceae bacterium]
MPLPASSTASHSALPGPDTVTRVVLDNGLIVLVRENHAAPVTVIDGYLPTGAIHDPAEKSGLASFVANMLNRGSAHYEFDTFNAIIEGVGASMAAGASDHNTSFGTTSLSEDFPTMLQVLADILRRPTFPQPQLQRLRSQKLVQIQERDEDTQEVAAMRFYEMIYPDHPYGRPSTGYANTVTAIERADLEGFHAAHYSPQGAILTVVGDVKTSAAIDLIQQHLGDWQGPSPDQNVLPIPTLDGIQRQTSLISGKIQADIFLGYPAVSRHHPDYFAVRVANTILGRFGMMGRLGEKVREEQGLAYYVYSSQEAGPKTGLWYAAAGVNPANIEQAVHSIQEEFARLASERVTDEELADTQAYLTGTLPLQLETNDGVASTLLNMEWNGLGLDYLHRYNDLIFGVTADDVLRAAQSYLRPDAYGLSVASPTLA